MVFHNFKFGFLDSILVYWVERKILWGRLSREGFSPTGWYSPQNRPLYLPTVDAGSVGIAGGVAGRALGHDELAVVELGGHEK